MDKKIYLRGMIAQPWYNFTEGLAYAITGRPIPDCINYEKRVHYGEGKQEYMNTLCLKEKMRIKKPLFIYIHGGGWISGITDMRNTYLVKWAKKGFFVCSLNYTYAPQKVFPYQLQEIYSAIDYIFDNAEKYNIDTENIIIGGESAGGYFLSYLAACIEKPEPLEKLGITFRHKESFRLKALVSHSGCFNLNHLSNTEKPQSRFPDMKAMLESFTGIKRSELNAFLKTPEGSLLTPEVNSGYPPCFLAWSCNDMLRFDTKDFVNELRRYNIPYRMFKGDGLAGFHAWTIVTMLSQGKECLKESFDYVLPLLPDYFKKENGEWIFI